MPFRLPPERQTRVTTKELVLSGVLVLLMFLIANLGIAVYLRYQPINWGHRVIQYKWSLLREVSAKVKWLFLGDSSGNQGLSVSEFQSLSGDSGLNLATYGGMGLVGDAMSLEYYIKHIGVPENVMLIHVYDGWARDLDYMALSNVPVSESVFGQLDFDPLKSVSSKIKFVIYNTLPLITQGGGIGQVLKHGGVKSVLLDFDETGYMAWEKNDPEIVRENLNGHLSFLSNQKFSISEINKQSLDFIERLADVHGFDVYIFNSPVLDRLGKNERFLDYYGELNRWMEERLKNSSHVYWMSPKPFLFPERYMIGVDHLTTVGAKLYTDSIFSSLRYKSY